MTKRRRPRPARAIKRLLTVYQTVADFTYDWELWIGPDGQTRYVSPSSQRISGYTSQEVLGDGAFFSRVIAAQDYPRWLSCMRASQQAEVPSMDFRIHRRDGSLAWLAQETTRVFDSRGRYQGLRLSLREVTDRVKAQQDLTDARERLEERVAERTNELHNANRELKLEIARGNKARKELEESRERFRNLSSYLQKRIEAERTRISREIHDELGQNLTALNMGLFSLETQSRDANPQQAARLAGLRELVGTTITTVQRISRELRPAILDELGLAEAIGWRARTFQESTGIRVDVLSELDHQDIPADYATALYRVFQEALTNVARHAGASRVRVWLGLMRGRLHLEIADNGCGISTQALEASDSLGLVGMRERIHDVGGSMELVAAAQGGTCLRASLPMAKRDGPKRGVSGQRT